MSIKTKIANALKSVGQKLVVFGHKPYLEALYAEHEAVIFAAFEGQKLVEELTDEVAALNAKANKLEAEIRTYSVPTAQVPVAASTQATDTEAPKQ